MAFFGGRDELGSRHAGRWVAVPLDDVDFEEIIVYDREW